MKVTKLKDIAQLLGISVTTVSKALKDYPDISEETKQNVRVLAEKLNYKPSSLAVNFRNKETKILGLIIPEIVHYFFSNVIDGIINEAEKMGYLVITLQSNESFELEQKQIELLLDQRVDGIIISLSNQTKTFDHLKKVIRQETPMVIIDRITDEINCSKVIIDDEKAAYQAVEHLIKIGCKRIVHINGPLIPKNSMDRLIGYKKALADYNIPYDDSLVYSCEQFHYQDGIDAANQALKDHNDIDGIFAITDLLATGAMTALKNHGKRIPEDVSVIGFSNWRLSELITPSLSTVEQPNFEMGKQAVSLLLNEIKARKEEKMIENFLVKLPTKLIERASTKPTVKANPS
ncbi:substrate-binding domain-containing protein [Leptobacterium flavescens]|uniref:Substrate-binding domain-containing protein n=1 Tax=Leptobacterium flavescens TaxID=472055 RepID=A0A6P0UHF3_9FLAO|nr:LacI family DNA-binding transcriptional regulator [Leptobacterium flavescens]NER12674.1 substrate-binding domain-containing protein [Leptobacterium flavescens]